MSTDELLGLAAAAMLEGRLWLSPNTYLLYGRFSDDTAIDPRWLVWDYELLAVLRDDRAAWYTVRYDFDHATNEFVALVRRWLNER